MSHARPLYLKIAQQNRDSWEPPPPAKKELQWRSFSSLYELPAIGKSFDEPQQAIIYVCGVYIIALQGDNGGWSAEFINDEQRASAQAADVVIVLLPGGEVVSFLRNNLSLFAHHYRILRVYCTHHLFSIDRRKESGCLIISRP
jgi:hypothetical protein